MTRTRRSRDEVIPDLRDTFRRHGYDGASLNLISDATGLGRASLYHHFPGGKDEMVEAALDDVQAMVDTQIIAVLNTDAAPDARLAAMAKALSAYYQDGRLGCLCATLALTAPMYRDRVRKIFERWEAALSRLAVEEGLDQLAANRAAEAALASIQGALVLAAAQARPEPFRRALRNLPVVLLGDSRTNRR